MRADPAMLRRHLFICSALLLASVLVGYGLSVPIDWGQPLSFVEKEIDARQDAVVEGKVLRFPAHIKNNAKRDIQLTKASKSCGCMGILSSEKPLDLPVTLRAGASLPIQITISTEGRPGEQQFWISVEGVEQDNSALLKTDLLIKTNILRSLRPTPSVIYSECQPGEAAKGEFVLEDSLPNDDDDVESIGATHEERFHFSRSRVADSGAGTDDPYFGKRWVVSFSYQPPTSADRFEEVITVTQKGVEKRTVRILFHGRVICPMAFHPKSLLFDTTSSTAFSSSLEYAYTEDEYDALEVVNCPKFVSVTVGKPLHGRRLLTLTGQRPPGVKSAEIAFSCGRSRESVKVPIEFIP
jgi:hypothetical protein